MASSSNTTRFMGVADTRPQRDTMQQHFDDTIEIDEFDEDEEGFIDVNVNSSSDDANNNAIDGDDDHVEEQTVPAQHGLEQEEEEEEDDHSGHLETAPLLMDTHINNDEIDILHNSGLTPPSHRGKVFSPMPEPVMKYRGTSSGDYPDGNYQDERDSPTKQSTRLACLKRSRSNGERIYEMDEQQYHHTQLDASSTHSGGDDNSSQVSGGPRGAAMRCGKMRRFCRDTSTNILRTTVSVMNFLARILLWGSFFAMIVGVVWYSRELKMNGTDPHLIAWFSAGAFVLLGFPISMCGIIMHLKNYYQPNVQCYVVRILWMVPIYSIESWLCLRFHELAIYIETLRDFYESYVLYSFFQFLIEVLGGEEALILMLKDKSPTRGAHIWGLGYCMKPWVMGQPMSRRVSYTPDKFKHQSGGSGSGGMGRSLLQSSQNGPPTPGRSTTRPIKKVQWTSPFFVKCKFGVLQYVLLKFIFTLLVVVLEANGLYKEGDFTPRGGYLYICILTNLSQCWALYCLVFFYYALKNELGPIRPVGKFLSVKALVFFTWWQSLGIAILFQMGMIPHYASFDNGREWTAEAVAKGLQDWLVCIEMFLFAIIHMFVFPHTDYLEPLGIVEQRAGVMTHNGFKRLGRKGRGRGRGDDRSASSKGSGDDLGPGFDLELGPACESNAAASRRGQALRFGNVECSTVEECDKESTGSGASENPRHKRQGFVRALLDSTLPRDVLDESVGIFKGEFTVEKKTLLHHATTSDEYDLFAKSSKRRKAKFRSTKISRRRTNDGSDAGVGVPDSITASTAEPI